MFNQGLNLSRTNLAENPPPLPMSEPPNNSEAVQRRNTLDSAGDLHG